MIPSLETISAARVCIAKEIQRGNRDPRLRAAFNELRQVLTDESERSLAQDAMPTVPCFLRKQAG